MTILGLSVVMKLRLVLSLGLVAVAVALAAPEDDSVNVSSVMYLPTTGTAQQTSVMPSVAKATQTHDLPEAGAPIAQMGLPGLYPFTLEVTEYCEASEGLPRMAKGLFSAGDFWYTHYFQSNAASSVNLGYPGITLTFGPYDYLTQQVEFQYGDCKWSETGYNQCGWCIESKAWSPDGLINCAVGNQEPRVQYLRCRRV